MIMTRVQLEHRRLRGRAPGVWLEAPNGFRVPLARGRSADLQSAVSPNCIRQGVGLDPGVGTSQSATLRYDAALHSHAALRLRNLRTGDRLEHRECFRASDVFRGGVEHTGGIPDSSESFSSGTPARVPTHFPRGPVVSASLRPPANFWHPSGMLAMLAPVTINLHRKISHVLFRSARRRPGQPRAAALPIRNTFSAPRAAFAPQLKLERR